MDKISAINDLQDKKQLRNKNSENYLETIRENERLGGAKSQAERAGAESRHSVAPNYDEESERESLYKKPASKLSL